MCSQLLSCPKHNKYSWSNLSVICSILLIRAFKVLFNNQFVLLLAYFWNDFSLISRISLLNHSTNLQLNYCLNIVSCFIFFLDKINSHSNVKDCQVFGSLTSPTLFSDLIVVCLYFFITLSSDVSSCLISGSRLNVTVFFSRLTCRKATVSLWFHQKGVFFDDSPLLLHLVHHP